MPYSGTKEEQKAKGRAYYKNNIAFFKKWRKNYYKRNSEVIKDYKRKWDKANKKRLPDYRLKWRYGLTASSVKSQLQLQRNRCALCDELFTKRKKFVMDHDHKTGKFRGLLHHSCNVRLGVLENLKFVQDARRYLLKSRGK